MSTKFGSASRAREIARLLEAWRRAADAQDLRAMAAARRAIAGAVAGKTLRNADLSAIKNYFR